MSIQAQNTELNIVPGGIIPVVHVSQYDVDRVLTFNLYDRNSEASLASGTTAVIEGTKPDGNGFQYDATISGNTVTVNTTIQMTVLSGTVECKIVLRNGSQVIGTALFIMDVEKAGINENTPMSETDLPLIIAEATEQMERAESAATAAALSEENAEAEALKAEGYATGKQNGEDVSGESPYYHNNAEYYSEYAESIADRLPEGLSPKGTCVFADLPSISESIVGDMWVISDSFTTTSDFRGGSGVSVAAGAYVYLTDSNKWDILPSVETVNPVDYEEDIYGVNLLDVKATSDTRSGITYTVDSNKTITLNGTSTNGYGFVLGNLYASDLKNGETYRLSDGGAGDYNPSGYTSFAYINGVKPDGTKINNICITPTITTFTADFNTYVAYEVGIYVTAGKTISNLVYYPMIYKSSLGTNLPFVGFNEQSIQNQLTDQTNVLGAKNLIPYPYADGDAFTYNGITYIVNSDKSITANGTSTAKPSGFSFSLSKPLSYFGIYQPGKYILSCGYFSVSSGTVYVTFKDNTENKAYSVYKYGTGHIHSEQEIVIDSNNINHKFECYIFISTNTTVNNAIIKPMLRLASDPDNTYVPYATTNRELTEVTTETLTISDSTVTGSFKVSKVGKVVTITAWSVQGTTVKQSATISASIPLPANYVATPIICANSQGAMGGFLYIDDANSLKLHVYIANTKMYGVLTYVCK